MMIRCAALLVLLSTCSEPVAPFEIEHPSPGCTHVDVRDGKYQFSVSAATPLWTFCCAGEAVVVMDMRRDSRGAQPVASSVGLGEACLDEFDGTVGAVTLTPGDWILQVVGANECQRCGR